MQSTETKLAMLAALVLTIAVAPTVISSSMAAPSGDVETFSGKTFILSITLPNNTKIPGPMGPRGFTGPQGIQGIQGIQGLQGPAGKNGTLQVCVQNTTGFCP